MRANISADKQQDRTFTESARRAQIVAAAIETIADVGYPQTSFTKIAHQAGLSSTGMISYHFAGKDDLMREVVREVLLLAKEFMAPRIDNADGYLEKLRAHIESNVEMLSNYPRHMRALLDIFNNAANELKLDTTALTSRVHLLEKHLRDGQQSGELGAFDPLIMAMAITGGIDAVIGQHHVDSKLDPTHSGHELANIFVRATQPSIKSK
jgi:AcrR family transcriptional regulator